MKVQTISQSNFKGYDARPLKGFLMSGNPGCTALEMRSIGRKEGFKIFTAGKTVTEEIPPAYPRKNKIWAQDMWTILKNRLLTSEISDISAGIKEFFNLQENNPLQAPKLNAILKKIKEAPIIIKCNEEEVDFAHSTSSSIMANHRIKEQTHIPGGNTYIVRGDTEDELIIGKDELDKYSIDEIKEIFNVNKVTILPQMDYHIDLFIRPLDNKKILVTDDNLTIEILKDGLKKLEDYRKTLSYQKREKYNSNKYRLSKIISKMEESLALNPLPQTDEIVSILEENGYETIRVPGRIYTLEHVATDDPSLVHDCNYMNANVLKKDDGDLVYITNWSEIDSTKIGLPKEIQKRIDFNFQKSFIKSISEYVKPEHIYFVKGKDLFVSETMLPELGGGIHCICAEIPKQ